MSNSDSKIRTLKEALQEPCKHRDMDLALKPMDNYTSTPGTPNKLPLSFWASWNMKDRPRRIALLLDDRQIEPLGYLLDERNLHGQVLGHRRTIGLVVPVHVVTECRALGIEDHRGVNR